MKALSTKQKIIITVLVLALLGILSFFFMCAASADNSYRGIGRQTFVKSFDGDVASVSNVQITLPDGTVAFSGPLPSTDQIILPGLDYGTTVTVTWTDWRGSQSETFPLNSPSGTTQFANIIPFPVSLDNAPGNLI